MDRADLEELHYIVPIANVPSILERGILSKRRAKPLNPASVAMEEVQAIRANKAVPGGRPLHDYVNLYILHSALRSGCPAELSPGQKAKDRAGLGHS